MCKKPQADVLAVSQLLFEELQLGYGGAKNADTPSLVVLGNQ
jgi:hypothetical protein